MENHQQSENVIIAPEPLLTVAEVSYRLHLSRSFTYSLMQSGLIPTVHINKAVRVRRQDLDAFIEHNISSPTNSADK